MKIYPLTLALLVTSCAGSQAMPNREISVFDIVEKFSLSPPRNHNVVEDTIGRTLNIVSDRGSFTLYELKNVHAQEGDIELIDYREPAPDREAKKGPILVINMTGKCIEKTEIMRRYDSLKITQAPRPEAANSPVVYSKIMDWGRVSFGFNGPTNQCLSYISISMDSI